MKLVYFGKKRPKEICTISPERYPEVKINTEGITYLPLTGKGRKYSFQPFKELEVDDEVGEILLEKAGDIFKQVDSGDRGPKPKPIVKTDGYVGDTPADMIPDLKKRVKSDLKAEEGKSIEQVIDESRGKKKPKQDKED